MINRGLSRNVFFFVRDSEVPKISLNHFKNSSKEVYNRNYLAKFKEVNLMYRCKFPRYLEELTFIDEDIIAGKWESKVENLQGKPYEYFVAGLMAAIKEQHYVALKLYKSAYFLLNKTNDISAFINICYLSILISQSFDNLGKKRLATHFLLGVLKLFRRNPYLSIYADLMHASTLMRLTVYGERIYKNYNLANCLSFLSIKIRINNQYKYTETQTNNYLAGAYRLYAKTFSDINDQYYWFKIAVRIRLQLVYNRPQDEFLKLELFYLLCDFSRQLILSRIKKAVVMKFTRYLYKTICLLTIESRNKVRDSIMIYGEMILRYNMMSGEGRCIHWYKILSYTSKIDSNDKFLAVVNNNKTLLMNFGYL